MIFMCTDLTKLPKIAPNELDITSVLGRLSDLESVVNSLKSLVLPSMMV